MRSVSTIKWADSKGDLSNIARTLRSRSSRAGPPGPISGCRSWRSGRISVLLNWTVRSDKHAHQIVPEVCLQCREYQSLIQEKYADRSLIVLHQKRTVNGLESIKMENNSGANSMPEIDLVYFTIRTVQTLEISSREMRTPELQPGRLAHVFIDQMITSLCIPQLHRRAKIQFSPASETFLPLTM
jgi:hypothetical protein